MPLGTTLPFGMRDIKLTAYTTGETLAASSTDLPNARTMSYTEAEDFTELRGDDKTITRRGSGAGVEWAMEGGGVSLDVVALMYGHTITSSGTTPAQVKIARKLATASRPFFKAEGQSISDSGGDYHVILYKCRSTGNLEGELNDGDFLLYTASGTAFPLQTAITGPPAVPVDTLYDLVQNETVTAIP
jgi:hypothetical protein